MQTLKRSIRKMVQLGRGLARRIRTGYYRCLLRSIGKNCCICGGVRFFDPENIVLGDEVTLNEGVILQSCNQAAITIGNKVNLAYGVVVITGSRDFSKGARADDQKHVAAPVTIGDSVVVNANAIILPGVTIGTGSVIAAGSLVTQDVQPYTMVFGVPAKVLKRVGQPNEKRRE